MSLDTLLTELNDPASAVHATDLTSLSRLHGAERERFLDAWRTMSVQRRRDIIDRLADLVEDNVELDFDQVFLIGLVDDDVQVRAESVKGLWEYEGDDLVGVLLRLLGIRRRSSAPRRRLASAAFCCAASSRTARTR